MRPKNPTRRITQSLWELLPLLKPTRPAAKDLICATCMSAIKIMESDGRWARGNNIYQDCHKSPQSLLDAGRTCYLCSGMVAWVNERLAACSGDMAWEHRVYVGHKDVLGLSNMDLALYVSITIGKDDSNQKPKSEQHYLKSYPLIKSVTCKSC